MAWDREPPEEPIEPLDAEQARALRELLPRLSVWRVLAFQAMVAALAALLAGWWSAQASVARSVAYGGLAVVLPGALFARGLTGRLSSLNAGSAVTGFFVWEFVKIGLTLAMLLAAPRLVNELSWPALLAGLVLTMKVVWLSVWMQSRRQAAPSNR
ncbi:MAG: ATP synthase subunit I [Limnohabitans sp.]